MYLFVRTKGGKSYILIQILRDAIWFTRTQYSDDKYIIYIDFQTKLNTFKK